MSEAGQKQTVCAVANSFGYISTTSDENKINKNLAICETLSWWVIFTFCSNCIVFLLIQPLSLTFFTSFSSCNTLFSFIFSHSALHRSFCILYCQMLTDYYLITTMFDYDWDKYWLIHNLDLIYVQSMQCCSFIKVCVFVCVSFDFLFYAFDDPTYTHTHKFNAYLLCWIQNEFTVGKILFCIHEWLRFLC